MDADADGEDAGGCDDANADAGEAENARGESVRGENGCEESGHGHAEAEEAVDQGCTFSSRTAHVPVQQAHSMSVVVQTTEVEAEEAHQPLP